MRTYVRFVTLAAVLFCSVGAFAAEAIVICENSAEQIGDSSTFMSAGYNKAVEKLNESLRKHQDIKTVSAPAVAWEPKVGSDSIFVLCVTITK